MVVDEEFFQFPAELLAQIIHSFYVRPAMSVLLDGYDPVIPYPFSIVHLFPFDYADPLDRRRGPR